jgi:hypothetical protein
MNVCETSIYAIGHYLSESDRDDIYDDHPTTQARR